MVRRPTRDYLAWLLECKTLVTRFAGLGQYDWAFVIAGTLLLIAAVAVGALTRRPILQPDDVRATERVAQA